MSKRKLDNNTIIAIAKEYSNGDITQSFLSTKYNVTRSIISNCLKTALLEVLVDQQTAELIADIAITHYIESRKKLGINQTNSINLAVKKYENLLDSYYKNKKQNEIEINASN